MRIASLLETSRSDLTATERRLADVIAADPARAATSSVAALAAEAGAHGASVVRLARKLGFDGFPDFRAALHEEAFRPQEPAKRLRERLDQLPPGQLLADLVRQEVQALSEIPQALAEADLDRAAGLLAAAGRILACGEGSGRILADHLADKLLRLGRTAESVDPTDRALAKALAGAAPGDVLVAVALTRRSPLLSRAMELARAADLRLVLIADPGLELGAPPVDVALLARRGPAGAAQTLVVPVAVASALVLATSKRLGAEGLAAAERYGSFRARLSGARL